MGQGGAQVFLMNLYRAIDKNMIQFDFLVSEDGVYDDEIKEKGGIIYKIPYITTIGPIQYNKELNKFFKTHPEYRIVHTHNDAMGTLVLRASMDAGVPHRICHSHNSKFQGSLPMRLLKQHYARVNEDIATQYFACAEEAARLLFPKHMDVVKVIPNPIPLEEYVFTEAKREVKRNSLGVGKCQKLLIHVGRFDAQKNHSFLIDSFSALAAIDDSYILFLAGDGDLRTSIEEKVSRCGLGQNVKFLGIRKDIPELMMAADLLLMPSLFEGTSLVLIEAQATGLSCLITDNMSHETIVRKDLLTLLPIDDSSAWAKKILDVIDNIEKVQRQSLPMPGYDIFETSKYMEEFYQHLA
jgi:glycosyltransferase involved in cell wall biosynthesis